MRRLVTALVSFVVIAALAWVVLGRVLPQEAVDIHVRWKTDVGDGQRAELERRFRLTAGEFREGTTWRYQLADPSTANIRALVQDVRVDDTEHLNRVRFRPEFAQDHERQLLAYSAAAGAIGAILALGYTLLRAPSRAP